MPAGQGSVTNAAALGELRGHLTAYFDRVDQELGAVNSWQEERDYFWVRLSPELKLEAQQLIGEVLAVAGILAEAARRAPLASEADQREIATGAKAIRAAVQLRRFQSWVTDVIHDEGAVLGVRPAGQSDDDPSPPREARRRATAWLDTLDGIAALLAASRGLSATGAGDGLSPTRYRPGTAFIMMSMDPARPELADVADAVKRVFRDFDVVAIRADDIEHEGVVTTRILNEIESAEFLFADLTGERPNVYYEVGYAHALKRRVILFRKAGTGLHFDLAGYNCPTYENLRDLTDKLGRRLESLTNRSAGQPSTNAGRGATGSAEAR